MASSLMPERSENRTIDRFASSTRPRTVRVLHVITGEHYAGAERVQDLLASELGHFGFEVGFACLKPGQFLQSTARLQFGQQLLRLGLFGKIAPLTEQSL